MKRFRPQDSQNKYHKIRRWRMNKLFEFQILHLKGDCRPEDFSPASCFHSSTENLNPSQSTRRIPQTLNASQPNFPTRQRDHFGGRLILKFLKGR